MASFRILTFGCKVNQCDSQILRETLNTWGLAETTSGKNGNGREAEVIIINTCTVTEVADVKFRKALRRTRRENPTSLIAVTGCYANKIHAAGGHIEGADIIFEHGDFTRLKGFLEARKMDSRSTIRVEDRLCGNDKERAENDREKGGNNKPPQSYFAEHTRAFLKIQDGCDCYCAYCVVPTVRNRLWSERPENVIASVQSLASNGYREVVLTGIHLGFFGRDSGKDNLLELLKRIETECEIDRIRLSSIEINEVSDEMLELITASRKICHHLHLPLQSGDDDVLRRMGRRYSYSFYSKRIERIRAIIPDIGITTDLIVGFPGETDEQFMRTCECVQQTDFAKIHVFRFSPRAGTRAAAMDSQVPAGTISCRARNLIQAGDSVARRFKERFVGQTVDVLVERMTAKEGACTGLTSNYIRVQVRDAPADCVNRLIPVRLTAVEADSGLAIGEPI
ncbi:MAG: tRNA (N(6)-L-threonylcarbamoyladenosine(37)-C(2))-methylthiotransferase MtaB [Candidatus Lindowbacteria bacterium]|nr:tRNA (N(6)-L-threonylcarbamoyladenosine(37)-C(2))-methylthiotransferase MtaB [Candidatus Lindowbacteria bacterium]